MVAALQRRITIVVKKASSGVAALVTGLAADDIEYESVARYLLVHLDLDDVATLDAGPVGDFELARVFAEYKSLNWLVIDRVCGLLQFLVSQ